MRGKMLILLLGCLSFLIFIIYDINQIKGNLIWIKPFFAVGCLTLCGVTGVMTLKTFESDISVYPIVLITFLFLGIGLGKPFVLLAGAVFTVMNILYVFIQDKYFFPKTFKNYDHYQQHTNFLLPSKHST